MTLHHTAPELCDTRPASLNPYAVLRQITQICASHKSNAKDDQSRRTAGLRTGPDQHPSLSVIRSQDRRVACRLCVPQEVQTCGYRIQSLPFSSACLINGRVVTCSCWSRSAVLS